MSLFAYTALNERGQMTKGVIEANGDIAARDLLSLRGMVPMSLEETPDRSSGGWRREFARLRPVTARDRVNMFRHWVLLLGAGVQLRQALETTALTSHPRLGKVIRDIGTSIEQGSTFADACKAHPRVFDKAMVASLRAGEAAGAMEPVLTDLADRLERAIELKQKVVTALVYPMVITLLGIGIVAFLVTNVIPRFEAFFQQRGSGLPGATAALVTGASFLRAWGPWLLIGGAAISVATITFRHFNATAALIIDRLLLLIPALGPVLRAAGLTTICNRSTMLMSSGVGLADALSITKDLTINAALAQRLEAARDSVLAGGTLHREMSRPPVPLVLGDIIRIGEESGNLPEVLAHSGRYFDDELERRLKTLVSLFEPMVLIVVGGLVGFVYFAFFQSIFAIAGT